MPGKVDEKKWQRAKEIVAEQKGHTPKGKDYGLVQHIYGGMKKEEAEKTERMPPSHACPTCGEKKPQGSVCSKCGPMKKEEESNSEMAEATTTNIERKAKYLKELMDRSTEDSPPWVVGKLAQAKTHVQDVMDYVGTDGMKKITMSESPAKTAMERLHSIAKEFEKSDVPFQLSERNWPGLDKAMKEWKDWKGVHKPATGKEAQGISEVGEKVRELQGLKQQAKGKFIDPEEYMKIRQLKQKAQIRHDDVLAQERHLSPKLPEDVKPELPKIKPESYAVQGEKPEQKVAQLQSKWQSVKAKMAG